MISVHVCNKKKNTFVCKKIKIKIKDTILLYFEYNSFLKCILLIMLLQLSYPPPLHSNPSCPPLPYSSCPWVIHVSSLASTFLIRFLPSSCLFSTYHLCYLFSVSFPSHSPVDNPPCDLHFCGSVPVLVVCLVCFCFCFRCGC